MLAAPWVGGSSTDNQRFTDFYNNKFHPLACASTPRQLNVGTQSALPLEMSTVL
jgi:hypothetical protein